MDEGKFILDWSDEKNPNEKCRCNHVTADTSFGRFLLTWKGWKDPFSHTLLFVRTPWGALESGPWNSVQEAKKWAEDVFIQRCCMHFNLCSEVDREPLRDQIGQIPENYINLCFDLLSYGTYSPTTTHFTGPEIVKIVLQLFDKEVVDAAVSRIQG